MMKTTDLPAAKSFLKELAGERHDMPVLAAVSGGLDSMCLLHLLATWGRSHGFAVTAAHFDHRLRGAESRRDAVFVRDWCAAQEIPFKEGQGDVQAYARAHGLSIEEAAREARYAFLLEQKEALGCTCLLTAHHADDNAETLLLNLLRGTGLRGLTGIPAQRDGIVRPFLQVTREELAAYAAAHSVPHVEDSTNLADDAARNVLRHQVLPVLRQLNPRAVENMGRTAALLRRDEAALDAAADRLLRGSAIRPDVKAELPAAALEGQPEAIASRAVWQALCTVCGRQKDLTAAHVHSILHLRPGGQLSMPYGVTVSRTAKALRFFKAAARPGTQAIALGQTVRFGPWQVSLAVPGPGRTISYPSGAVLTVGPWDPHDRLDGRTLKRLWADRGLSPAERDLLPVLRIDGQAAAAPLLTTDQNFAPDRHENAARVIFFKETEEKDDEQ